MKRSDWLLLLALVWLAGCLGFSAGIAREHTKHMPIHEQALDVSRRAHQQADSALALLRACREVTP